MLTSEDMVHGLLNTIQQQDEEARGKDQASVCPPVPPLEHCILHCINPFVLIIRFQKDQGTQSACGSRSFASSSKHAHLAQQCVGLGREFDLHGKSCVSAAEAEGVQTATRTALQCGTATVHWLTGTGDSGQIRQRSTRKGVDQKGD